jgi:hypothetical protein
MWKYGDNQSERFPLARSQVECFDKRIFCIVEAGKAIGYVSSAVRTKLFSTYSFSCPLV